MRRLLTDAARTLIPPKEDRHGPLPPLLLVLTMVTGLIDAVSYLGLGHVFVANMTGNVVFLGFALAGAPGLSALASIASLAAFLAGALAGGHLGVRLAEHRGRLLTVSTAVQSLLMAAAVVTSALTDATTAVAKYTLIVLLALGMGLQNAVARRLGVPDLTTTVLTLTLTGLAADSTPAGGTAPRPGRRLLSVLAMFLGALGGAELLHHSGTTTVLQVALAILVVTSVATHRLSTSSAPWTRP
ncbi:YoaK family protein [Streptacidiphilus sp. EB129]|uniref:YoaK family protein n=1 Tax=Streptacidiphilus sp. EB129 TaxID=3156262 RepID=UPI003515A4C1